MLIVPLSYTSILFSVNQYLQYHPEHLARLVSINGNLVLQILALINIKRDCYFEIRTSNLVK